MAKGIEHAADILFEGWREARDAGDGWLRSCRVVDPDERRILVFAPHMDDEVIGCGGTLIRSVAEGAWVTVAFVTDGSRGSDQATPDLVGTRKTEAATVAGMMGTKTLEFIDAPDGRLEVTKETVASVTRILTDERPQALYVPWPLDSHRDHFITSLIVARALVDAPAAVRPGVVRTYEVWTPLWANVVVDITSVETAKRAAIAAYESQFISDDPDVVLGLNRYRSLLLSTGSAAEAFREDDVDTFVELMEALSHRD